MPDLQIDTVTASAGGMSANGSVALRLMQSGFDIRALRPCADAGPENLRSNAVLRKDEWMQYDTALIPVARKRLVGIQDLIDAGLRYPLANALGTTRLEWEQVNDITDAAITMSGIQESEGDRPDFTLLSMPIPIVHKDFNVNIRALEASRKTGQTLDTTMAELAGKIVAEKIESVLFQGWTGLGTNNPIYGYQTSPNRNTGSVTAAWTTATGAQVLADVLAMMAASVADNMYGPWVIYVSAASFVHLGTDHAANYPKTILSRILEIPGITAIRPTKDLTGNSVLMIQMTREVVDLVDGIRPTTVQWDSHAGFVVHFKVLAIMPPRVRGGDVTTQSGIMHYS